MRGMASESVGAFAQLPPSARSSSGEADYQEHQAQQHEEAR
jgi:hypothetical protein